MYTDECTCLESTLIRYFNGGKKQAMFLKNVRKDKDGNVTECFTKKGAKVYDEFVDVLYKMGDMFTDTDGWDEFYKRFGKAFKLTEVDKFVKSIANVTSETNFTDMVDVADRISDGQDYF